MLRSHFISHTSLRKTVDAPCSALSANSHHGYFSLVQNANGIANNYITVKNTCETLIKH